MILYYTVMFIDLVSVHVHQMDVESHQLVELYAMGCHPKTIAEQISAM